MRKRCKQQVKFKPRYTLMDEMMASQFQPLPAAKREYQAEKIKFALNNIERSESPCITDWQVCTDAVNMMETLIVHNGGEWKDCDGDTVMVQDSSGLLEDAKMALARAGQRVISGKVMRLDGPGIHAVRSVVADYAELIAALPAREVIKGFRITERRVFDILHYKKRLPGDITVVCL